MRKFVIVGIKKEKEIDNMEKYIIPNKRQEDGSGVPDMPRPKWDKNAKPDFEQFQVNDDDEDYEDDDE